MADENTTAEAVAEGEPQVELRPCAFCGAAIHPQSHRCHHCGGHVGLAWGTVHKELWLFVFASVLVVAGCLASWTGRMWAPVAGAAGEATRYAAVPSGTEITGLDTIRGSAMFALALYGLIAGIFNVLYRRIVVWPYLINALIALWVGVGGIVSSVNSGAFSSWKANQGAGRSLLEGWLASFRAVPPAFFLLTLAGAMVLLKLLGGILSAAGKAKGKAAAARKDAPPRRRRGVAAPDAPPPAEAGSGEEGPPPAP